ncbi:MAG TPA: type II toxin-antitoxin system HicA family toxin [Dehalococcoidia bacterium]|nr:type II toxin-antitoxin system HicA family toxin [Dehalococcoidia bacterium]
MKPLKRRELIRKLRKFGYTGPVQSGKHPYMERGDQNLTIPGEHGRDIGVGLQKEIIKQAGISRRDWKDA